MKLKFFKISIAVILFIAFGYFIQKNFQIIQLAYKTTLSHMTGFVLVAFGAAFLSETIIGFVFKRVFKRVGIIRKYWKMVSLHLAGVALAVIVPSAGLSSTLVFSEDAEEKKESKAAAITGYLLFAMADYLAISVFVLFAMTYLSLSGGLGGWVLIPALIFLFMVIAVYVLAWLSFEESGVVGKFFVRIFKLASVIVNTFSKKKVTFENSADKFLLEFSSASKFIFRNKKEWLKTVSLLMLAHVAKAAALYFIFVSLGYDPTYRVLLTGYAVGILIVIVSPTPMGIGFVEGAMALAYGSLGVPTAVSTTAVLIYRVVVFWLPFLIGFTILQGSRIKKAKEEMARLDLG